MKIELITVSAKQPQWVDTAYQEYAKRLNQEFTLELKVIPPHQGKNTSVAIIKSKEAEKIQQSLSKNTNLIALDEHGKEFTSVELAGSMEKLLSDGKDVSLVIGGANGLEQSILSDAKECWALSKLTLPHGMVRVLVAEQLYRAWSIIHSHPYHKT